MKLESVSIKNFRNINELDLKLSEFDVLVGENNAGKTNILSAICNVLSRKVYFKDSDFKNSENPIIVELSFSNFDERAEEAIFFDFDGIKNPENNEVRIRVLSEWKESINDVNTSIKFVRKDLSEDEQEIKEVPWNFKRYVSCYHIPAHRDLKNEIESKKGIYDLIKTFKPLYTIPFPSLKKKILKKIDDLSVLVDFDFSEQKDNINSETQVKSKDFKKILASPNPNKKLLTREIKELETQINIFNKRLKIKEDLLKFQAEIKKDYGFESVETELNEVTSEMFLKEKLGLNLISVEDQDFLKNIALEIGGYPALSQGDGYQNVINLILKLLKFFKLKNMDETEFKSFVVILEEPESHLHPHMQRNLIKTIKNLQKNFRENGLNLQFILSTHSPFIIAPLEFENLNFIRKNRELTNSIKINRNIVEEIFRELYPGKTIDNSKIRNITKELETLFDYRSEVFFSKCIILGEGPTEEGAIPQFASKLSKDLDKLGVSFLQVEGEGNLKYYTYLFDKLQIPTVLIVDSDKKEEYKDYHDVFFIGDISTKSYKKKGAFESEIIFNCPHNKILRSLDSKTPQSTLNRIGALKGIFPKLHGQSIEQLEDVCSYLDKNDKENPKYRKLILGWMVDEKGFFFGRILAKNLGKTEIPNVFDDAITKSMDLARGFENETD